MNEMLNLCNVGEKPAYVIKCDSCGKTSLVSKYHKRYCPVCGPDTITPIEISKYNAEGMKTYSVIFEEVIQHEFTIESPDMDSVPEAFDEAWMNSKLDFSDGDVISGQLIRATDETTGEEKKLAASYADLEAAAER